MRLVAENKKVSFIIKLTNKANIIQGPSGSFKTFMVKTFLDNSGATKISLSDTSYSIRKLHVDNWESVISNAILEKKKNVYLIDDADFIASSRFLKLYEQDKLGYYIIFNRIEAGPTKASVFFLDEVKKNTYMNSLVRIRK